MDCRIRKLIVRGSRSAAVSTIVHGVENALRTASFPGIPPNALVIVRSLRLRLSEGPLGFLATAQQLDEAGRILAAQAVPATSSEAARSSVVWFQDAVEPMVFLALQLARGRAPREWFWKGAVPDWNGGYDSHELPRLMKTVGRCSFPQVATIRVFAALLAAHRLESLLDALTIRDGRELLGLFGFREDTALENLQRAGDFVLADFLKGLDGSLHHRIQSRIGRWGIGDPRTLWLLVVLLWRRNPFHRQNPFERPSPSSSASKDDVAPHGLFLSAHEESVADCLLTRAPFSHPTFSPPTRPFPAKGGRRVEAFTTLELSCDAATGGPHGHEAQTRNGDVSRAPSFAQPGPASPEEKADLISPTTARAVEKKRSKGKNDADFGVGQPQKDAPHPLAIPNSGERFLDIEHPPEDTDPGGYATQKGGEAGSAPMEQGAEASPAKGATTPCTETPQGLFVRSWSASGAPQINPQNIPELVRHPVEGAPSPTRTFRFSAAWKPVFPDGAFRNGMFFQDGTKPQDPLPSLEGRRSSCGGFLFLLGLLGLVGMKDSLGQPLRSGFTLGEGLLGFLGRVLPLPHDDPHWALMPDHPCLGEDLPDAFSFCPPTPWIELLTERAKTTRRVECHTFRTTTGALVQADRAGRLVFGVSSHLPGESETKGGHIPDIPETSLLKGFFKAVRCILALFLHRRVGLTLRRLVVRPGRLVLSPTHVDVFFALDQADAAIRRWALDVNPGWVPWLGRVVSFHYIDEILFPARSGGSLLRKSHEASNLRRP
uniref:Uncharacterized protein n=1 Tax=Desulfacinum infernum TaxID=35837 RepID=A0A832A2R6_9BACT